ncbi:DUF2157 domain-containing protein [Demequina salsinemoris]|uniref:DUF2157 domain-containing protein n=1 Tax=Demequina salsinemoris TaxID=577470 RepID=UPI00078195C0|nr:DUF2157 domain-containing protein [Demequina salsinemoris]
MIAQRDRFDEWVEAGLLEATAAEALRRYENDHGHAELAPKDQSPTATPAPPPAPQEGRGRALALVGEILGYLGAVLAITAISFLVSQTWSSIPTPGRIALVALLTAVVGTAGFMATHSAQDAAQRLASALLLATVVSSGWLAWVLVDAAGLKDEIAALWTFLVAAAVAATIYAMRRRALAQLALLAATLGVAVAAIEVLDVTEGLVPGLVIGSVGAAWAGLAIAKVITPAVPALIAGGLVTVSGISTVAFDEDWRWLVLATGVAVAVAMLMLAVLRRELITLMVPGGIGLLMFVPQLMEHLVGNAVATWTAVLVTGIVLIVVSIRMLREPRPD